MHTFFKEITPDNFGGCIWRNIKDLVVSFGFGLVGVKKGGEAIESWIEFEDNDFSHILIRYNYFWCCRRYPIQYLKTKIYHQIYYLSEYCPSNFHQSIYQLKYSLI